MSDHAAQMLQDFVDRTLRLRDERSEISGAIRDVASEAKAFGFDKKAFQQVVLRAEKERGEVVELDMMIATYEEALGSDHRLLDPLMNNARDASLIAKFATPPDEPPKLSAPAKKARNIAALGDGADFAERALGIKKGDGS